jgi:hypothetical protein
MTYMDDLLTAMIIAGIGLSIAYLRAEFVLRRGRKVKEREKAIVQHELHTNRLRLEQRHVPVTALRIHQPFLSKQSALCAPAEWASSVYSRKSADVGIAQHRELA